MRKGNFLYLLILGIISTMISCTGERELKEEKPTLFSKISSETTNINFINQLTETPQFNILNYLYFYNGGGVAVGDVNNDSLPDLYFTANMLPNKLYLNRGNFEFEDISDKAGVAGGKDWSNGVTMADVNGDGLLDIYVCQLSDYLGLKEGNKLYINQGIGDDGIPTFSEKAEAYGLNHNGFSTHSAFFDFDQDGDLDMYLLNHSVHTENTYVREKASQQRYNHDPKAGDRFFRNDSEGSEIKFTDITQDAGIYSSHLGYGLGLAISDLNMDGWPDIYVGNDFHENDYLYLNNKNGTFREVLMGSIAHTSRFSMGVDIADINNDLQPDIVSMDMKPEIEEIIKTSAAEDGFDIFQFKLSKGFYYQFARNNLQLHQGVAPDGLPKFSEIGQMANIPATDWSWSPLLADFDNDGFTDLFITNGIYRRPNDMDYLKYISDEKVKRSLNAGITEENLKVVLEMPEVKIANYSFKNNGNLGFENTAGEWGFETDPGYSNGAVYADLDNDGDLDLVVNNLDEKAGVYRNNQEAAIQNNYLKIKGVGEGKNTFGIGMQVQVFHQGKQWVQELYPTRGFQSSMGHELSFGLGEIQSPLDSVKIKWAGGKTQMLKKVAVNQLLVVAEKNATDPAFADKLEKYEPLFTKVNPEGENLFVHRENGFTDFNNERLLPHKLSTEGPALAVGDVNNDGLEDFYIGGARNQSGQLFIQNSTGEFDPQEHANINLWENEKHYEDVAAEFFDVDNDGDLDLFIGSGGYDLPINNAGYSDRLYLNNGSGEFEKSNGVLPELNSNTSCATSVDFDLDGDIDLFVGIRAITGNYGLNPDSYLLENDGSGKFNKVDSYGIFKGLGMVTDAIWTDTNEDSYPDLVVVGEWMPITIFENSTGVFMEAKAISNTEGWWNTIESADLDGDGDQDFVVGNLGLNSDLRGTVDQPMQLYIKDFDQNSANDPILSIYRKNRAGDFKEYPFDGRDKLIGQMPHIRKKFVDYKAISGKTIQEIFSEEELNNAVKQKAVMMESAVIENMGNGKFQIKSLPKEAQFSPISAISIQDFNGDGHFDLLAGGNIFGVTPSIGQFDASMSQLFIGNGKGGFESIPNTKTGMWVDGEIKEISPITNAEGEIMMLIAINNAGLEIYKSKVIRKKNL